MADLTVSSAVDTLMQASSQSGLRTACGLGNSATLDTGTTAGTVATGDHVHGNITSAGAIGSTANLPLITGTAGAVTVGAFGTTANSFCEGNDSRLSDARTPLSHTHGNISNAGAIGSTSGLPIITTTSGVLTTGSFGTTAGTFAEGNHTHAASAITSGTLDAARLPTPGTTTLGGVKRNTGSAGQYVNGIDTDGGLLFGTPSGGGGSNPPAVELSSDWTTTDNSTLQNITGLSFSMAANTSYLIQAYLIYTTSASGTGSEFGVSGPASPTRVNLQGFSSTSASAEANAVVSAFGSVIANANGSTADRPARIIGVVRNGANSGTFQLQGKLETGISGTLTVKTGSALVYTTITV